MSSSHQSRRRRQQASFRRHQLRIEGLEKRYALNAAPVLDDSASPTLGSILEDTGAPVGPAGTLVSDLIDAGGPLNNFSDVDGDQPGIAITDSNLQGGTLWYSRDDGVSWFDVGVLSNAQPLLMPAVTGSRLYYEPAPDFNGTIADVFTIKAWDQHTVLEQIGGDLIGEAVGDLFGTGVSLSADGTTVAIGGYKNDSNGINSGHVRVFQWNGSAWSQLGDDLLGIGADEKFGYRICISDSGDRIAVSAFSNSNGWDSGMVQIYQWNGLSWQQLGENLVGNAGDLFGHALATSANVDIVVAGASYGGYVQAFKWNGAVWEDYGRRITAESAGDGTGILESLSLSHDGSVLAVGSQYANDGGSNSGKVRLFNWTGNDWSQLGADLVGFVAGAKLSRPVLSADGNIVAVGAVRESAGTVRVYRWDGVAWRQLGNTLEGDAAGDQFGYSVAMSDDGYSLLIGAFDNDSGGGGSGQAKLFRLVGDYWEQLGSTLNGTVALEHLGVNVDVSSDASRFVVSGSYQFHNSQPGVARVYDVTATESSVSVLSDVVSIEVRGANDPPVLQIGQSVFLAQVQEDSGAPVGAVGSLVSELIDASGPRNNFSDVDGDPPGIAIVEQELQGGTLWHSLDNGVTWEAVGNASEGEPFLLFSDSATRLYYQPAADFSGTLASVVKFRAWDGNASWEKVGLDLVGSGDGDLFGRSVAISTDGFTVAVGGHHNDKNGADSGEVRVYTWSGDTWTQLGEDIVGDAAGDKLGFTLDLSADGRRLVVGMSGSDLGGDDAGAVRVFEWSGTAWVQLGPNITGTNPGDRYGHSVTISKDGSTIAAGSNESDYVNVYSWNGIAWQQLGSSFTGTGLGSNGTLSSSRDGTVIALGAAGPDDTPANSGVVRVFQWFNNEWVQLGNEIQGDLEGGFFWRTSLSADGMTLAVGAYSGSGGGVYSGAGYVRIFRYSSSGWQQMGADLVGNNWSDRFGWSVSLSENSSRIVVGSDLSDGNHFAGGEVQAFRWDGAGWLTEGQIINGAANLSRIGISVDSSANGNIFVAGSYQEDASGRASVFRRVAATGSTSSEIGELSVDVLPVNDAPILDTNSSPTLEPIAEDASVPVGQVGTLVSSLIDTDGPLNNFSDVDGDLPGIAITGVNLQGGSLWFSNDDGGTWLDVGAVSDEATRLLAADATTRVYFRPAANFNGTISDVISFKAWDRTPIWQQLGLDIDGEAAEDNSGFSASLSSDGQTVAIGALLNDGNGTSSGHTRIYRWTGSTWTQLGANIDGEAAEDKSGRSVSLSSDGQTVAIGAFLNDGNGTNSGHTRIYRWTGSTWTQLGANIDGEAADDLSGFSASLSSDGQTVAIGAFLNDGNGTNSGHTRIYRWTGSTWTQLGADIDGEAAEDNSGRSVSLSSDGQTVAVGAYVNDGNGLNSGHTRIYRWTGSAWTQLGADIDGEAAEDNSGFSVSLSSDGQTVAIGARFNDGDSGDINHNSGHVRIYSWNGSVWSKLGADIDGEAATDHSGHSVSLSADGQTVAIGAHLNDGNGLNSGHTRIYRWTGSTWTQLGAHIDGEAAGDLSGFSVSLSFDGQTVAIGAYNNDGNGTNSGHVRIFQFVPSVSTVTDTISVTVDPVNEPPTLVIDEPYGRQFDDGGDAAPNGYPLQDNAAGNWSYSTGVSGTWSTTYYPTTLSEFSGVTTHGFVTYRTEPGDETVGRFTPLGSVYGVFHVYETYVVSDFDQTVSFVLRGDDGHSIFVDDEFITGAGFRVEASGEVTLLAGVPRKITLVGHNGIETTNITFQVNGGLLEDISGIQTGIAGMIPEDTPEQLVSLSGITAGGSESQPLRVTATSSNPSVIPDPTVTYTSTDTTGNLSFTPVTDAYGTATITVIVEDGGLDSNLETQEDNATTSQTFTVTVTPVNDTPALDPLSDLVLPEDSQIQIIDITGIAAGGGETQPLQMTVTSSNPSLISDPTITSQTVSVEGSRSLAFVPLADQYGITTITVTVEDGGLDLDLNTTEDNAIFSRTFDVTVTPDTDDPPSPVTPHGRMFIHEILSGDPQVSYQLPAVNVNGEAINGLPTRVTVTSNNTALIPDPTVLYAAADVPSSLSFTPTASANGTATLSIQVEDGGPDNDFSTTDDNRQATHHVEVNVLEVISNQGSAILSKDGAENLYVNTQPVVYHDQQQAQSTIAGFAAIGATSEDGENALLVERASVTNRLVTDDAWRINSLFDSLQNESSPVLDLSAREVSVNLNVVAVAGAYEINGVRNPTLIVRRGQIYNFKLDVANHPLYLQITGNGYQPENAFNRFFQGQGRTEGDHMWIVPADAPDELFYQCEFHPVMFGKIIVVD